MMATPDPKQTGEHTQQSCADAGYLSEIFCSIQGEGPYVGQRQVFVRTAGCSATCSWCDTVYSKALTPRFVVHDDGPRRLDNPIAIETAVSEVMACVRRNQPVGVVSITGGEPLEQPEFVIELARRVHKTGVRVYLETNGVHDEPLASILPYVDVVAMDIKLPSSVGEDMWDAHRRFIAAGAGTELFVKIVMDARSTLDEVRTAVDIIASASRGITLVLQPESETLLSPRTPRETARALMETIDEAQKLALASLDDVRVMPQLHKILKVR